MTGNPRTRQVSIQREDGDHSDAVESLREQVALLAALVEQQQALAQQHQSEIDAQRAEIAELRGEREASVEAARAMPKRGRAARTTGAARHHSASPAASRRDLLKWGGAAAAAATVALVASKGQEARAAEAVDGNSLLLGAAHDANNTASTTTTLSVAGSSSVSPLLQVNVSASSFTSGGVGPTALAGIANVPGTNSSNFSAAGVYGSSSAGFGVYGISGSGPGVYGTSTDDFGLEGQSTNSFGVYGTSTNADAIHGEATSGAGVYGFSEVGVSLYAAGGVGTGGRIFSLPYSAPPGAPSGGPFSAGEQIRDSNGDLWLCTADGSPGTWVRVAHVLPSATGGAISFLTKPTRLLDTRGLSPNAVTNGGGMIFSGIPRTVQVAGVTNVHDGVSMSSASLGAIGKLTVISYSSGTGFVAVVPSGSGTPNTGTLPYGANQTLATGFTVGLGGSPGSIDIYVTGTAVDVVIDMFAVVA